MNSALAYEIKDQIHILVVDDDIDYHLLLKDWLAETEIDHRVTFVRSVPEAMAVIDQQEIDIVLLDYLIRPHTGFDLFTYIKKQNKKIPCVVLTNYDSPKLDQQSVDLGVSDLIAKRDLNAGVLKRSILYSIRDSRQKRRLEYLAHYDVLTGLLTRRLFYDYLDRACEVAKRNQHYRFAVLFIDLDHFKTINDTYGHDAGDGVLKQFALRLMTTLRHVDTAARLGGDEFMVLLHDATPPVSHMIALKILRVMEEPILVDSIPIKVSPSIGIATNVNSKLDVKSLISDADHALYCAKSYGRGTYCHFNEQQSNQMLQSHALEKELKDALQHRQFELYYLPCYHAKTLSVTGFEVRERWNHPTRGPLMFVEFAKELKRLELENQYVKLVVDMFLADMERMSENLKNLKFSININPLHFLHEEFVESVIRQLMLHKINPSNICLEFDERYLIDGAERFLEPFHRLRRTGLNIMIDHFGELFSSLNLLMCLPVNMLKLDKRLLNMAVEDGKKSAILQSVVAIAKSLNVATIMEGVESVNHLELARDACCDELQGLYFGEPVKPSELHQKLAARRRIHR